MGIPVDSFAGLGPSGEKIMPYGSRISFGFVVFSLLKKRVRKGWEQ